MPVGIPGPPDLGARYRILREIGSGGAGRVFLVRDEHLGKSVALKLLHEEAAARAEIERLKREFTLLSRLHHPGVAAAHDFGFAGERPYFTSEYVPGKPLGARGGDRRPAALLDSARTIAASLGFLHRSRILHLDVKPGNVLVPPGDRGPVLIDFGLFRTGLPGSRGEGRGGSLPYMAPECFRGGELGPFTDIYALGVTLYRVATGAYPRAGAGAAGGPSWDPAPLPPSRKRGDLPRGFDDVVLKCLALDPARRYGGGAELEAALEILIDEARVKGRPPSAGGSFLPTIGRVAELAAIDRFLEGAGPGAPEAPGVLLVTGARGMGQTRLFAELKVRAQTRGVPFYLETGYPGSALAPGGILRCLSRHMDRPSAAAWRAFLAGLNRPRAPRADDSQGEARRRRAEHVARSARALAEPHVLGIDGLQHLDEVSVELVIDLVRFISACPAGERPPLRLALGYREEGLLAGLLSELTEHLLDTGRAEVIALGPLGPRESIELHRLGARGAPEASSAPAADPRGLDVYQRTGGVPAAILELAAGRSEPGLARPQPPGTAGRMSPAETRLFLAVASVEKPARTAELARIARMPPREARRALEEWRSARIVSPGEGGGWVAGPAGPDPSSVPEAERRAVHRSIAREILRKVPRAEDPRRLRAVHHFREAGDLGWVRRHGLALARHLKSVHRARAAVEVLETAAGALDPTSPAGIEAALEMADLRAKLGDAEKGIDALGVLLSTPTGARDPWRIRILLRLGTLHARRGDFRRAEALLEEGLAVARARGSRIRREEVLFFLNEHAAVKAFVGRHDEALRICSDGIRLAAASRDVRTRELALNFHATRGNVHLRRFEFDAASLALEKALDIAHATGSLTNRAIILNNLGIVQSQCDRYREAARTYREAERICFRIDDGPSLVYVRGNLALVHAKLGDFESSTRLLDEVERSGACRPGEGTRREALFLEHHRALCLMYQGRHASARPRLERAIGIASEIGDRFIQTFDSLHAAECLLFEAEYDKATEALEALALPESPPRMRRMALARLALARALEGRGEAAREAIALRDVIPADRPVALLDAWDDLFIGWALSIGSSGEEGRPLVERARSRFRDIGVRPGAALASWVAAEALFLRGKARDAEAALAAGKPCGDLTGALWPLLGARLALETGSDPAALERCSDLLAEAGGFLVGALLPEWSSRLDALRRSLESGERGSVSRTAPESRHPEPYWKSWTEGAWRAARPEVRKPKRGEGKRAQGDLPGTSRTALARARGGIVARSSAMQAFLRTLDRLRESELAVLITGETGSGKEMAARLIHAESRRSAGPFRVLDCASIPEGLIESEVFGARAGAFTDLTEDRPGILVEASGGTVLVDDVAGLSLPVQAKLLRVLSSSAVRPVGAEREVTIDVRFLFASREDLDAREREGRLRADLLHRIRVLGVRVPPLRERHEDIADLARTFLAEGRGSARELDPAVLERLERKAWPGNVRELRNLVLRLAVEHPEGIPPGALDDPVPAPVGAFPEELMGSERLESLKDRLEREYTLHHLKRLGGDMTALSRFLGLSPKHCYRRLRELGISLREERRKKGAKRG